MLCDLRMELQNVNVERCNGRRHSRMHASVDPRLILGRGLATFEVDQGMLMSLRRLDEGVVR